MKIKHEKKSPSMTWVGLIGFQPDSWDGIKRSGQLVTENLKFEEIY